VVSSEFVLFGSGMKAEGIFVALLGKSRILPESGYPRTLSYYPGATWRRPRLAVSTHDGADEIGKGARRRLGCLAGRKDCMQHHSAHVPVLKDVGQRPIGEFLGAANRGYRDQT
jgi:hypothetical protein